MHTFTLPGTDLVVPDVVLGLMRIQDKSDDEVRTLVRAARDAGIAFVDHADIYGDELHGCETRFAEAMDLTPAQRDELVIQTKCGIVKDGPYFDFSYEHILESVEGSLRALRTDRIDILLLHRPPTRWWSPTRSPARSTSSRPPARSGTSASRTTRPPGRSTCSRSP